MTQASVESYKQTVAEIPEKQKIIYDALLAIGPCTYQKIVEHLHLPDNRVTNRLGDLVLSGWAIEDGEEYNERTHRNNTIYRALTTQGPKKVRGHKNTGAYIGKNDVEAIMRYHDVQTNDYIIHFRGFLADVTFIKIWMEMRDVEVIATTDKGTMVFANKQTTMRVPII